MLKGISLFSGAGGMDIGLRKAGVNIIWANDLDKIALNTYKKNFNNHIISGDITSIQSSQIPNCDIVFGGPPCQGFSVAGKMSPTDQRSNLIWDFVRVVKDKKPKVFIMENVKNLAINEKFVEVREKLLKSFREMGYLTEFNILNSKNFGVPQSRERVIFIGVLKKLGLDVGMMFPLGNSKKEVTVRDVLSGLPLPGKKGNSERCNARIVPAKNPVMRKSPYAGMLFNGQGRPLNLDRPAITMTASMGGNKTPFIDERFLNNKSKKNWVEEYHERLRKGAPPLVETPGFLRRITVFEAALLQSFPKNYIFEGSQCSKYRQIGNAVPPKLAYAIGKKIIQQLKTQGLFCEH